jgi:hypothetical protein
VGGLLAVGSQGCTVTASDQPLDGGITNPGDDSSIPSANDCNECLFEQCSGQWSVCQNSADCRAIYECAIKPGTTAQGVGTCFCASPNGQRAYAALSTCDSVQMCNTTCASKCATRSPSCPAADFPTADSLGCPNTTQPDSGTVDSATVDDSGGATDAASAPDTATAPDTSAPPPPVDAGVVAQDCNSCVSSQCSQQQQACASGTECDKFSQCVAACTDAQCVANCGTSSPTGQQASQALATCTSTNCATQCGL